MFAKLKKMFSATPSAPVDRGVVEVTRSIYDPRNEHDQPIQIMDTYTSPEPLVKQVTENRSGWYPSRTIEVTTADGTKIIRRECCSDYKGSRKDDKATHFSHITNYGYPSHDDTVVTGDADAKCKAAEKYYAKLAFLPGDPRASEPSLGMIALCTPYGTRLKDQLESAGYTTQMGSTTRR